MADIPSLIESFAVGTFGAGLVAAWINWRLTAAIDVWRSQRGWEEKAVSELLGPVFIQLDRTKRAFDRWDKNNLYLEGEVIRSGNLAVRDLLLGKPHLIPVELREAASELVLHYDVWLEEFTRVRALRDAGNLAPDYVFVGPRGYGFPKNADEAFRLAFKNYWEDLYPQRRPKRD